MAKRKRSASSSNGINKVHIDSLSPQEQFNIYYYQGTELLQKGQTHKASRLLLLAYQLNPNHVDVALNLGGALILLKQFKQAVLVLERLSRQDVDNAMVWTNLGAAYLGNPVLAGDEQQLRAIEAFEKALQIDPVAPNVAYNIGLIYLHRKDTEQARSWFKRAIKANPRDKDARVYLEKLPTDE